MSDKDIRAGVHGGQTAKYRRPDRPKRVGRGDSAGFGRTACIRRIKQEKYCEVRDGRHRYHTGAG
jgi:hypothetical protein